MFTQDTLKDKTILVTGGGSGLGLSMSKAFAQHGAKVAICGRNSEKLKGAAQEIEQMFPEKDQVKWYAVDVRDYKQVGFMVNRIIDDFGSLNTLVNNAAGNFLSLSHELSDNGFNIVVDIVLKGTFNCTRHFGRSAIDRGVPATILNIATTYAESGSSFVLPSACAKAGVLAMTRSLAHEWAPYGIRLNAIAPGTFPTEGAMSRLFPKRFADVHLAKEPMKRYGEHQELCHLAIFLLSDLSSYLTGDCIYLDGAEHLHGSGFNFMSELVSPSELKHIFRGLRAAGRERVK